MSTSSPLPEIVRDLIIALEQGHTLVTALSDEHYRRAPQALEASSIGAHYRHHIEHVQLLVEGVEQELVDYDRRPRDERIEQDRDFALQRTRELIAALEQIDETRLARPLKIAHRTCVQDMGRCASSNLRRELLFLLSHTVHHYALIKLIAQSFGQAMPRHFGVMPSTLAHLDQR